MSLFSRSRFCFGWSWRCWLWWCWLQWRCFFIINIVTLRTSRSSQLILASILAIPTVVVRGHEGYPTPRVRSTFSPHWWRWFLSYRLIYWWDGKRFAIMFFGFRYHAEARWSCFWTVFLCNRGVVAHDSRVGRTHVIIRSLGGGSHSRVLLGRISNGSSTVDIVLPIVPERIHQVSKNQGEYHKVIDCNDNGPDKEARFGIGSQNDQYGQCHDKDLQVTDHGHGEILSFGKLGGDVSGDVAQIAGQAQEKKMKGGNQAGKDFPLLGRTVSRRRPT